VGKLEGRFVEGPKGENRLVWWLIRFHNAQQPEAAPDAREPYSGVAVVSARNFHGRPVRLAGALSDPSRDQGGKVEFFNAAETDPKELPDELRHLAVRN
jgi:hypothetical protein